MAQEQAQILTQFSLSVKELVAVSVYNCAGQV